MTSRGRGRESLPVPPIARAHISTHTENPPSPSPVRISETAVFQPCPKCRRHVLAAMTDGLLTRCDLEALTIPGELAALLSGLLTYDVHVYGLPRRMHLEHRNIFKIRAPRKHAVVAQHRCGNNLILLTGPADDDSVRDIVVSYRSGLFPDIPPF